MPTAAYAQLVDRLREIHILSGVEALLDWDQETYMPARGGAHRANQLALVAGLTHERRTSDELGRLLGDARQQAEPDSTTQANLREAQRDFDRAVRIPVALVKEIARASSLAKEAWAAARAASRFADFAPHLDHLLDLKRQQADAIGWQTERYDALMDEYEPGAKAANVHELFETVRRVLVPLVAAIAQAPRQPTESILTRHCPVDAQAAFNRAVASAIQFDFDAGRMDVSVHPFCTSLSPSDVRITTRYDKRYMPMSLFGVLHEVGHALYEQGLDQAQLGTPCGAAVSLGVHESQSRTWENLVGRSRPFWEHFFPKLRQQFPSLQGVSLDDWTFAINRVRPSLIRVEADEVTYNLHIMLRFELERELLGGTLRVNDVPAAWNERMRAMLGVTPPDDAHGCLQDIHWSIGGFGYFPTYALGNLYGAQLFEAARAALPNLDDQFRHGQFSPLREWLRENVHRRGRSLPPLDLIRTVCGAPFSAAAFTRYLRGKFEPLYGLPGV